MNNFKYGLYALSLSWGWDLYNEKLIEKSQLTQNQGWQHWGVRLYKMSKSSVLFGLSKESYSLRKYGLLLLNKGYELSYGQYNFKDHFNSDKSVVRGDVVKSVDEILAECLINNTNIEKSTDNNDIIFESSEKDEIDKIDDSTVTNDVLVSLMDDLIDKIIVISSNNELTTTEEDMTE